MGSLILVASVAVWFLSYFPRHGNEYEQQKGSYIGQAGGFVEPAMEPLGLNWKAGVAIITGTVAKEVIVSTLGVLYSGEESPGKATLSQNLTEIDPETGKPDFNMASALSFLVFVLLYFPCLASLVVIKQEAGGWRWAAFSFIYNTLLAWLLALLTYNIAILFL
jgi:ferrous iron transport protein B